MVKYDKVYMQHGFRIDKVIFLRVQDQHLWKSSLQIYHEFEFGIQIRTCVL